MYDPESGTNVKCGCRVNIVCQCRFTNCNQGTTLLGDLDNGGNCVWMGQLVASEEMKFFPATLTSCLAFYSDTQRFYINFL